jgi:tetratricopeptide (TPR) repeat protein
MKKWTLALCIAAAPLSQALHAQTRTVDCDADTIDAAIYAPEHQEQDYKNLKPSGCIAVAPPRPLVSGVVSARTLAHKPSKSARKEYDRGVQAEQKGQHNEAIRHFSEAGRLDPNYVEAEANLGILYSKTGQPEAALEFFDYALVIEPNSDLLSGAKAAALVMLSRWGEAEQSARRALKLNPRSVESSYMLGLALLMQGKITPETARSLEMAASEYPKAREHLADVQAKLTTH